MLYYACISFLRCIFILFSTYNFKDTLTTSQDKAFRRISELKEQIQLDLLAKQHIEENYMLMIEEKDELIKVLHTQVIGKHFFQKF
jgi:hypothetical protein